MCEKFPGVTTLVTTENRRHICQDGIFKDISYDFLEIIQSAKVQIKKIFLALNRGWG